MLSINNEILLPWVSIDNICFFLKKKKKKTERSALY